jgi:4-amino-4-deoxy-L-arabinose transferase-like glycosyltransferase
MGALARLRNSTVLFLLTCLLLALRIGFRSHYLYDIDSVNFALGMRRFDPAVHQPHPPGYFLYIELGRIADKFFHDANASLVAISIAASCGALLMIFALTDNWFGRRAAFFASLLFVFSPLVWFHGTVALTYAVEAFFSALTGYLCWRIYRGSEKMIVPGAVSVGLAAGFRPSFLLFLSPLLLFSLFFCRGRVNRRSALAGAAALVLTLGAWLLPMVSQSGGFHAYWSSLLSLWRTVPGKQTAFNSSPANAIARLFSIAGIYVLCFGCAALLSFRRVRREPAVDRRMRIFIWIWIGPGLLFFTLIFLKFVNSGYLLVISPPAFAWLGLRASQWYEDLRLRENAKIGLFCGLAAVNSLVFLFAPVYCSYTAVRRFEAELQSLLRTIPQVASPVDTMIVGFDSHFFGYRHAGYYLPNWFVVQYPEVRLESGMRVFAMEHGDTRLRAILPLAGFRKFIFFPLPVDDSEYREYMTRVRARFPQGILQKAEAGGRDFTMGAVTDLTLLFPVAAGSVYAAGDIARGSVNGR